MLSNHACAPWTTIPLLSHEGAQNALQSRIKNGGFCFSDRRAHSNRNLRFGDNVWFSKMLESDQRGVRITPFFLWLAQKAIWGQKSTKKLIQEIKIRFIEPPRVFWRAKP